MNICIFMWSPCFVLTTGVNIATMQCDKKKGSAPGSIICRHGFESTWQACASLFPPSFTRVFRRCWWCWTTMCVTSKLWSIGSTFRRSWRTQMQKTGDRQLMSNILVSTFAAITLIKSSETPICLLSWLLLTLSIYWRWVDLRKRLGFVWIISLKFFIHIPYVLI